jgi:hypothetical protein
MFEGVDLMADGDGAGLPPWERLSVVRCIHKANCRRLAMTFARP